MRDVLNPGRIMGAKEATTPKVKIIGCGTPSPLPDRFGSAHLVDIAGE